MEGLLERLGEARAKVRGLWEERARTGTAMAEFEARSRRWNREADVLKARIQELEQENEVLRTAKSPQSGGEREGTKEQIDELVNEIDQCLALLNK